MAVGLQPTRLTDEQLARAFARTGDPAAIDALIRRYAPRLRRLVIALLGPDESRVLDAEQEVFVTLVRKLAGFQGEASFATFFYRLAHNRVLDLLRSEKRRRARIAHLPEPDASPTSLKGPQEALEDQYRAELVRHAMRRLAPRDRLLLYLKDGEDHRIADLAQMTGMASGTIKSRLARSRARLKKTLEELGYEP